ncbi:cupin domain-containing protein [Phenylobacterium sp.]|uniref:cupin domain-containing protein n=1 Tax=Phenylobacterium sp. TaxID=1871053 RepID=UPI002ED8669D
MGECFEDGPDRGRILVSGDDTGGRWSLMEYEVAARAAEEPLAYGPHLHREIEETFIVQAGRLRFLLGEEVRDLGPGDRVCVSPGVRHGFANVSGAPVKLLVSFHPGGFEQLFVRHRTDQDPPPAADGFLLEATRDWASEFEPR